MYELGSAEVSSLPNRWYEIQIDSTPGLGGENPVVSVSRGLRGNPLELLEDMDGTAPGHQDTSFTNISFGIGSAADYRVDDVRLKSPSSSQTTRGQSFSYDALGRRVAKTVYTNGVAETTYFAYDGHRVAEEVDGAGNVVASYVYGNYIDEVLRMDRDFDGNPANGPEETFYYLHDDQYNVLALVHADDGNIAERYEYGPYGEPYILNSIGEPTFGDGHISAIGNPYMFNGRRWDSDMGLYWYRTRYMDPKLGRFIARDTIGLWGDEANLGNPYTYAGNNPWTNLDPYGEDAWEDMKDAYPGILHREQVKDVAVGRAFDGARGVALVAAAVVVDEVIMLPATVATGGANHVPMIAAKAGGKRSAWQIVRAAPGKAWRGAKALFGYGNDVVERNTPWEIMDDFRRHNHVLEEMGEKILRPGDGHGTVAFVDVDNVRYFGVNSKALPNDDALNLARTWKQYLGWDQGRAQALFHAEGNALMEAFYQVGDKMPKEVTLYVDRATCSNCRIQLPKMLEAMGIEKLIIKTKEAGKSGVIEAGEWIGAD